MTDRSDPCDGPAASATSRRCCVEGSHARATTFHQPRRRGEDSTRSSVAGASRRMRAHGPSYSGHSILSMGSTNDTATSQLAGGGYEDQHVPRVPALPTAACAVQVVYRPSDCWCSSQQRRRPRSTRAGSVGGRERGAAGVSRSYLRYKGCAAPPLPGGVVGTVCVIWAVSAHGVGARSGARALSLIHI